MNRRKFFKRTGAAAAGVAVGVAAKEALASASFEFQQPTVVSGFPRKISSDAERLPGACEIEEGPILSDEEALELQRFVEKWWQ